jgi:hypothetical protein
MVTYTVLYAIGGREVILVNSQSLTIRTEIFGVGPAKSYRAEQIRNLRFQPALGVGKGRVASRIAFDYGAKTIMFGADIDEPEADDLISRIRQRSGIVEGAAAHGSEIKFSQPQ